MAMGLSKVSNIIQSGPDESCRHRRKDYRLLNILELNGQTSSFPSLGLLVIFLVQPSMMLRR